MLLHQILTNKKCHKTTGTSKSAVPKRPFLMLGIPACETVWFAASTPTALLWKSGGQLILLRPFSNNSVPLPHPDPGPFWVVPWLDSWINGGSGNCTKFLFLLQTLPRLVLPNVLALRLWGKRIRFFLLGLLFHWCGTAAKSRSRLLTLH